MKDIQQLIKKEDQGGFQDIFPKTYIDAVEDKKTGITLETILSGFNMYFLSYVGSKEETRLQVPMGVRKQGLWITYIPYNEGVITEWYDAASIANVDWRDGSNWRLGNNMLVGDITISANGTWIINGVDTGVLAQGEKGDKLLVRVSNDHSKIEYSYNDANWNELFPLASITPIIKVDPATFLPPGTTPTVRNIGDSFNVELSFGLPASSTTNVGSVSTLPAGSLARVTNRGTQYEVTLDFSIPVGNTGAKGEKGDGWEIEGFLDEVGALPVSGEVGDMYLIGTQNPYQIWVYRGAPYGWVNMGSAIEIKASVFDGGRADTMYGGARTIDCGGADAFLI